MADKISGQEKESRRRPMTPEQRESAAKARAEEKTRAVDMTPAVYVQYQDTEGDVAAIIASAKEQFQQTKKRTRITDMKVYIKPEERTAYYVINGSFDGRIEY